VFLTQCKQYVALTTSELHLVTIARSVLTIRSIRRVHAFAKMYVTVFVLDIAVRIFDATLNFDRIC